MNFFKNTDDLVNKLVDILSGGVSNLLMSIAFLAFLGSIINYIWKRRDGNADGLKQAGNMLFGSTFALFVMVAVWGIVNFISGNIFGPSGPATSVPRPQTNFRNGATSPTTNNTDTSYRLIPGSPCSPTDRNCAN